jgi:hypothetical protein
MDHLHDVEGLVQSTYAGLNHVQGLLIALIAAILMKTWKQLFPMAAGATLAYLLIELIAPTLRGGAFHLPNDLLTLGFVVALLAKFVVFAVIIGIFFLIKSIFVKPAKA